MHIVIPDDYQDAVRGLDCFARLDGHTVTVFNDTVHDIDALAERFRDGCAGTHPRQCPRKDSYELYFGQAFDAVVAFANGSPINVVS